MDFAYQWQLCDERGRGCGDIEEATESSYTPTEETAGSTVRVLVSATNSVGEATAASRATPPLLAEPVLANTSAPRITGTLLSGETLSADEGLWTGTGTISHGFQWQRCDAHRLACTDIEGATSSSLRIGAEDVGHFLAVRVTARDENEFAEITTFSGQVRAEGAPAASEAPALTGAATVGETLGLSTGRWTGTGPITYAYQWQACE
jgi:hypothetical protein